MSDIKRNDANANKPVLAMYDVRSKQKFIYRTNKMKEIAGGSRIIRDVFKKHLKKAADDYAATNGCERGIYGFAESESADFTKDGFLGRMESNSYLGEIVYSGGGNFLVVYRDEDVCRKINRIFTRDLLEEYGTLKVLCTYIEANFDNFKEDRRRLYACHAVNEAKEIATRPVNTLPFVQIDRKTSLPIVGVDWSGAVKTEVSQESRTKRRAFENEVKENGSVKDLDELVKNKGEDSLLAVVYIDGNGMGAKVQECLDSAESNSYDDCVRALRKFSKEIETRYVTESKNAVHGKLGKWRLVLAEGDEMTFICRAEEALTAVRAYFDAQQETKSGSSCAGIAVFHSHAPFSEIYRIAEECCESGKKYMHEKGITEAQFVDFHYCQSGIGTSLEAIRAAEAGSINSKPWCYWKPKDVSCECAVYNGTDGEVDKVIRYVREMGRSNIKGLASAALTGEGALMTELARIEAHADTMSTTAEKVIEEMSAANETEPSGVEENKERFRRIIYDVVTVYDIWFVNEKACEEVQNV